jgi:prolyl-tRNA synthetase
MEKKKKESVGMTAKKEGDFSEWYTQIVQKAELIEYSDVSGCYILRPRSYEIWEKVQGFFDNLTKKEKVKNVYFPLLIPEKLLNKEKEHIKGFNPEVAWVTHAGNTKLKEKLAIRPTSETIMYDSYSKWIRSWRDLPLKLNQYCNIVRWEFKHPVPFLRSREFLWQEGHNAFSGKEEVEKDTLKMLDFYARVFEELYCVPIIKGRKSESEKFAGADYSLSVETFLPNGKAIQGATSHNLGQNFSKAFNIKFLDKDEKEKYVWQNSWGLSTRSIGIMIMMHGDDKGLILPPKLAEEKVVIVPILFEKNKDKILKKCKELSKKLNKYNVILDDREDYSAGWKFNEWELKGIPIRLEIGPKDLEKKQVIMVRRDNGKKESVKFNSLDEKVKRVLEDIQKNLFDKAKKFLENSIKIVKNKNEFKKALDNKNLIKMCWCDNGKCEDEIKNETGAKCITIPFKQDKIGGNCAYCGKEAKVWAYFGRSY